MMNRNLLKLSSLIVFTLVLTLCCAVTHAQQRNLVRKSMSLTESQNRVALVVGNSAYKDSPLANPANDAKDISDALRRFDFSVTLKMNASKKELKQALREFGAKIKDGGVGVFYFAGHGVQSNGRNFLIPVDASIESEAELEDESLDLALVMSYMDEAKNGVNIVILDACRNNPFARSFRSLSHGLAQVDAPSGTLLAYATAPGSVAGDGTGRNGIYTKYLLESLQSPDTDVEKVFKRVRKAVYQETGGKQIPWESSSLIGDFAFNHQSSLPSVAISQNPQPVIDPAAFEIAFWNEIKDRSNSEEYRAYLEQYPNGTFSKVARARINELTQPPPQVIQDAARVIIGTWSGTYAYGNQGSTSVPFKLLVTNISGSNFQGLISEPATFGNGTSKFLFAKVVGNVDGARVKYVKTYDGTSGVSHSVNYQGILDASAGTLSGGWAIGSTTGPFEAQKN